MTEENGMKFSIIPSLLELQNTAARYLTTDLATRMEQISTGVSSMWSETTQNNIEMMRRVVTSSIEASLEPLRTATFLIDMNKKLIGSLLGAMKPFRVYPPPVLVLSESILMQYQKTFERMTEGMRQASTLNLASSLQEIARAIDFDTVVSDHFEVLLEVEVPREVVHERLEQVAEKEQEETGQPIPYNVLSMKFIINVYLPCLDMAHSLDTVESIDKEFAVRFIMFNVLPLVYFFATKEKEPVTKGIDFNRDVVFSD